MLETPPSAPLTLVREGHDVAIILRQARCWFGGDGIGIGELDAPSTHSRPRPNGIIRGKILALVAVYVLSHAPWANEQNGGLFTRKVFGGTGADLFENAETRPIG